MCIGDKLTDGRSMGRSRDPADASALYYSFLSMLPTVNPTARDRPHAPVTYGWASYQVVHRLPI